MDIAIYTCGVSCINKTGNTEGVSVLCAVEPLYDWSGRPLSSQEFQMLRHYQITFRHLVTVFDDFCSHSSTATESGEHG